MSCNRIPLTRTGAMWLVVGLAIALTPVAMEIVLGAIKIYSGAVSDRLYVAVLAAASISDRPPVCHQ